MTISFENDNDIIKYGLMKIISYSRSNQWIFLAQSVWWISSLIGLQIGSVIHIDNLQSRDITVTRGEIRVHPGRVPQMSTE